MLRIRLRRVGKKGKPSYRIVVAESAAPRDGAFVEWIGHYDPMVDPPAVTLKADRAIAWLKQGAQPSDAVRRIFDWDGIYAKANSDGTVDSAVDSVETAEPVVDSAEIVDSAVSSDEAVDAAETVGSEADSEAVPE